MCSCFNCINLDNYTLRSVQRARLLGPQLFIIAINDCSVWIQASLLKFADDTEKQGVAATWRLGGRSHLERFENGNIARLKFRPV